MTILIIKQRIACLAVSLYTVCNHAYLFWLCDDSTDLVLNDDVGLNPSEAEVRNRVPVLSVFGRVLFCLSAVALTSTLTSDRSLSTLATG